MVQPYTHPLWFLGWIAVGNLSQQWILGVIALSLACTGAAVGLLAWRTPTIARLVVVAALLLLSNAFVEYATSGLENPLAYLTVGLLLSLSLAPPAADRRRSVVWAVAFGATVAAVLLTRLDLSLVIAPIVVVTVVRNRRDVRLVAVAVATALVPLAGWFLWSYSTYETWLPNTFAAKRNLQIPEIELFVQGLRYVWVTFENDPTTPVALALGIGGALALGTAVTRAWAVGLVLYLSYVVWIGGDFMVGRFFAVPVYVAVFLVGVTAWRRETAVPLRPVSTPSITVALIAAILLLTGSTLAASTPVAVSNPQAPRWEIDWNINGGIADERGYYVGGSGRSLQNIVFNLALAYTQPDFVTPSSGAGTTRSLREIDKAAQNWPTTDRYIGLPADVAQYCGGLGSMGMVTGPTVHLIDDCALTDRFLAERPFVARDFQWRTGDFHRTVPEGYADAIRQNDPTLMRDPADAFYLAQLWERIRPSAA